MKNISSYLLCLLLATSFISFHQEVSANIPTNGPPTDPTITGPTARYVSQNGTYTFTSTDPDGDLIYYEVDWDNNGTVDQRLPSGPGTLEVASGVSQSQANNWAGPGVKTFQARTTDSNTLISEWTPYSVTVSCTSGKYTSVNSCVSCTAGYYCSGTSTPIICPVNTYCTGSNTPPDGVSTNPPTPCGNINGSPASSRAGSTGIRDCLTENISLTSASPSSCTIATGTSTCGLMLTWVSGSTIVAAGLTVPTSSVTTNNPAPNTIVYTANSGSRTIQIPYDVSGSVIYYLYRSGYELASTTVGVSCAAGSTNWDTIGNVCANPQVGSAVVTGDYYSNPATLDFTCLLSDRYQVTRRTPLGDTITVASGPYTGPASTTLSVQDNYKVICKHGSVEASQTFLYHYPAPEPGVSIDAHPKTTSSEGASLITWSLAFPTVSCTLTATAVCANNICTNAQVDAVTALNGLITSGNTDSNDPQTSRPIAIAVNTIAPGHQTTDYKAIGRKTFQITKTTDFTIDCGNGKKATTRIRKANNNEQ